jgi:hypothetical protein
MALVQAMGRHRSHGPAPTKRKVVPLARKQPNRRCSCGCGRPGKYLGRLEINGEAYHLGYYATRAERTTVGEFIARYLARYEREHKASSYAEARCQLTRLNQQFAERPLSSITRHEAIEWADGKPGSLVKPVVTLFNAAVDEELIDRNPFRGLAQARQGSLQRAPADARGVGAALSGL